MLQSFTALDSLFDSYFCKVLTACFYFEDTYVVTFSNTEMKDSRVLFDSAGWPNQCCGSVRSLDLKQPRNKHSPLPLFLFHLLLLALSPLVLFLLLLLLRALSLRSAQLLLGLWHVYWLTDPTHMQTNKQTNKPTRRLWVVSIWWTKWQINMH